MYSVFKGQSKIRMATEWDRLTQPHTTTQLTRDGVPAERMTVLCTAAGTTKTLTSTVLCIYGDNTYNRSVSGFGHHISEYYATRKASGSSADGRYSIGIRNSDEGSSSGDYSD